MGSQPLQGGNEPQQGGDKSPSYPSCVIQVPATLTKHLFLFSSLVFPSPPLSVLLPLSSLAWTFAVLFCMNFSLFLVSKTAWFMCHWKIRKYQEEKILNLMTEIFIVNILICTVQTLWLYKYFCLLLAKWSYFLVLLF